MNLLEHYIQPGYTITDLHDSESPVPGVYFVKFEGEVDVYGTISHVVKYWPHTEWLKIKKQGYYLA